MTWTTFLLHFVVAGYAGSISSWAWNGWITVINATQSAHISSFLLLPFVFKCFLGSTRKIMPVYNTVLCGCPYRRLTTFLKLCFLHSLGYFPTVAIFQRMKSMSTERNWWVLLIRSLFRLALLLTFKVVQVGKSSLQLWFSNIRNAWRVRSTLQRDPSWLNWREWNPRD